MDPHPAQIARTLISPALQLRDCALIVARINRIVLIDGQQLTVWQALNECRYDLPRQRGLATFLRQEDTTYDYSDGNEIIAFLRSLHRQYLVANDQTFLDSLRSICSVTLGRTALAYSSPRELDDCISKVLEIVGVRLAGAADVRVVDQVCNVLERLAFVELAGMPVVVVASAHPILHYQAEQLINGLWALILQTDLAPYASENHVFAEFDRMLLSDVSMDLKLQAAAMAKYIRPEHILDFPDEPVYAVFSARLELQIRSDNVRLARTPQNQLDPAPASLEAVFDRIQAFRQQQGYVFQQSPQIGEAPGTNVGPPLVAPAEAETPFSILYHAVGPRDEAMAVAIAAATAQLPI